MLRDTYNDNDSISRQVTEWCHHGSLYDLLHTSEYFIRDSSIGGRMSFVSSKRHSGARPSNLSLRMSNTSSVDMEEEAHEASTSRLSTNSTSVNLKEAVALLEEGYTAHISADQSDGSSGGSGRTNASSRRSMKSGGTHGSRSAPHSSMRIVVDPKNETVSEVESSAMSTGGHCNGGDVASSSSSGLYHRFYFSRR